MQIVEQLIGPYAANVLVETHGPQRHHLALRIGVELRELLQETALDARELGYLLERVVLHKGCIDVEVDRLRRAGRRRALGFDFKRVVRTQSVPNVDRSLDEGGVVLDEILVDPPGHDDVVGDVVKDRQIRAWLEYDRNVGKVGTAVGEGREHRHLHMRVAQSSVREPRPQDRMHLRHVRAPQHEGVRRLEIVIAAHRLVHAEGAHECERGGRHAVAGIRIEVVGAKAGPHQFGGGIAFRHCPLS